MIWSENIKLAVKDLFFVGDVNQMANPSLPVRLAMQLAMGMKLLPTYLYRRKAVNE